MVFLISRMLDSRGGLHWKHLFVKPGLDLFYPSEWYENCPFSVMESQMYGTPVLGADNWWTLLELIQVGKTGELSESGNVTELKERILRLWNNKSLTDQYSQNCKDVQFDDIVDLYKETDGHL